MSRCFCRGLSSGKRAVFAACALLAAPSVIAVPEDPPAASTDTPQIDIPAEAPPAQTPSSLPTGPVPVVLQTSINQEPYTRWTTHTGTAADAVVHVRVEIKDGPTGHTQVREGTGLVIRCDGFVLVPAELLTLRMRLTDGQVRTARVADKMSLLTFAAGDDSIPPPLRAPHPRFFQEKLPFAITKINDHHLKALQMLAPHNVKEGMAVRVVYARTSKQRPDVAEAVMVDSVVGKPEAGGARFAFAGAPPRVPPGAVVVDAASGLAIGIVPGSAPAGQEPQPAPAFATFAPFHHISNAVGLLPDSRARERPERTVTENEGMLWIPGGPLALQGLAAKEHAALWSKWVVCMPGFWIDRREVTNEEYREFLYATSYNRLPKGWVDQNDSVWWRESPVTGVSTEDATTYAAWRGKRLVTPVEWARASLGAEAPLKEYLATFTQAQAALSAKLVELNRQENLHVQMAIAGMPQRRAGRFPGTIRPNVNVEGVEEIEQIREARRELIEGFNRTLLFPRQVVPAGWREVDRSIFGVRDVAMNVKELLQPNLLLRPMEVTLKQHPALIDPNITPRYHSLEIHPSRGAPLGSGPDYQSNQFLFYPGVPLLPPVRQPDGTIRYVERPPRVRQKIPLVQNGFRCAR